MSFLKLLKLQIEVRLPHQLTFLLYVVLFVVDGLPIELFVVIIIQGLILIVIGHDWLASLPNAYYHFSFIYRWRSRPEIRNRTGRCDDTGAFFVSDRREVSDIVGDDIVGVAANGAMIERVIFRIWREFSSRGFGYLFSVLGEQFDESSRRIARDFETPQDLAILRQNLLGVEPGKDLRIITPGQHQPQFGCVWFRRLLAERPRRANHDGCVNDHAPKPATARHYFFLGRRFRRYSAISCSICSSLTP